MKPFCFVLMPFGVKTDDGGRAIDFDRTYREIIKLAIEDADLEPIRADEETVGGIIHKPMFERLMVCDYAVADLSTANPNVLYELGIRHGIRPHTTVLIYAKGMRLPFDVAPLRALAYQLDKTGAPLTPADDRRALATRLISCRKPVDDSPLFQLVPDWSKPDLSHLQTDAFRELVEDARKYKEKLRAAREAGPAAIAKVEAELNVGDADPAIVLDLFLSYRAVESWQAMVDLAARMSPDLSAAVRVRQQLGFALNRLGRRGEAEQVLLELIARQGPDSETNGILGRIYKDQWEDAVKAGRPLAAFGYLRKAIETYLAGFEADWRDPYPGVNAVTLMEMEDPVDPRQSDVLPVVRYGVRRRIASKQPDYWDHATRLELSVLAGDRAAAIVALGDALAVVGETWMAGTTERNLRLIREAREKRKIEVAWIVELETELHRAASVKPA